MIGIWNLGGRKTGEQVFTGWGWGDGVMGDVLDHWANCFSFDLDIPRHMYVYVHVGTSQIDMSEPCPNDE